MRLYTCNVPLVRPSTAYRGLRMSLRAVAELDGRLRRSRWPTFDATNCTCTKYVCPKIRHGEPDRSIGHVRQQRQAAQCRNGVQIRFFEVCVVRLGLPGTFAHSGFAHRNNIVARLVRIAEGMGMGALIVDMHHQRLRIQHASEIP